MYTMARAVCIDASAMIRYLVEEPGSSLVREFIDREPCRYMTPFCFYETLSVLKRKYLKGELTRDAYDHECFRLAAWFGSRTLRAVKDVELLSPEVLPRAQQIARDHNLDLSDAFQILSVRDGYFSRASGSSQTLLITADRALAEAARSEGLLVWNCREEPAPKPSTTQ